MRKAKLLFDFYLNASIHVAVAVFAFSKVTRLYFNIPDTKNLDFVIFLSTIVMYNFIKYGSRAKKYFIVNVRYEKRIQIISFIAAGILIFLLTKLTFRDLILLSITGILSLLYIIPLGSKQVNLRSLSTIKIFIVALVWSLTTVIIPMNDILSESNPSKWITLLQRFLFVLALILPFEIRDMDSDAEKLQTLPRRLGVRNTKIFGYLLLLALLLLEFCKNENNTAHSIALIICSCITFLMLRKTGRKPSFYFTAFWVESIPIILWVLYALLFRLV